MIEVKGLVLCGGQSKRMGKDKSWFLYNDVPQNQYCFDLLKQVCGNVYLSIHRNQTLPEKLIEFAIEDQFDKIGPAGGLLSAYKKDPACAWLVIACDMPCVRLENLQRLIKERGSSSAIAFRGRQVEPLLSIWEPAALKLLLNNVKLEKYSLRDALLEAKATFVNTTQLEFLTNINAPQEKLDYSKSFVSSQT